MNPNDAQRQFLTWMVDLAHDAMCNRPDEFGSSDNLAFAYWRAQSKTGPEAMTAVQAAETSSEETAAMLRHIVQAELDHWVPDASQRLIWRAGLLLGLPTIPEPTRPDCGPKHISHPLIADWVAGIYVMRCVSCNRLFDHS